MKTRTLAGAEIDLALTLAPLRRGFPDPTIRIERGVVWRATRTPEGPATMRLSSSRDRIEVDTWGPGTNWALAAAPEIAGCKDDPSPFIPADDVMRDLHRRFEGLRLCRSRAVVETLVPTILEQKVPSVEAFRCYARLVRRYGEPAPGPAGLVLPPAPEALANIPYYEFHSLGIERNRAEVIRAVCSYARRLEETVDLEPEAAARRLTALPGVGGWTAAEVARVSFGDPDAVRPGDFHLPHHVAWVLAGEEKADDARMMELLEPYRGQRGRAARLIEVGSSRPPRRAPRQRLRAIQNI